MNKLQVQKIEDLVLLHRRSVISFYIPQISCEIRISYVISELKPYSKSVLTIIGMRDVFTACNYVARHGVDISLCFDGLTVANQQ